MLCEVVAAERAQYLQDLRERVATLRKSEKHVASELLVQPNGTCKAPPFSVIRVDVIRGPVEKPRIERVVARQTSRAVAGSTEHKSGIVVLLETAVWEDACFSFYCPQFETARLCAWYSNWLDIDETKTEDSFGLSGVVHSLDWTSDGAGNWQIDVDFGSAPLDAFEELLIELAGQGVRQCHLTARRQSKVTEAS